MNLTITFSIASLIGMAWKLKQKNDSLKDLAVKGNFEFPSPIQFLWDNRKSIIWMVLAVVAFQVTIGKVLLSMIKNSPTGIEEFLWGWALVSRHDIMVCIVAIIYMTISFMGQDFLFAALNRTSKEVRNAIDYKTTIADEATNNLQKPTPLK